MRGGLRPLQKSIPLSETGSSAMKVEVAARHPDSTDETMKALARLLGRQAAREAFRAACDNAQIPDPAPTPPPTTIDEE